MKSIRAAWRPTVLLVVSVALAAAPIRAADSPPAPASLPRWSAACSHGQGRLLLLDNTGGDKQLGQALARALAGRAAASSPAGQPSVEVRTPANAALAAGWAVRDKPPRADLVVVHLTPTGPITRQGLDDYAASCAHLARELARSGGDVLLLAPSACGSWATLEVCAALRAALEEDSLSAGVAGAEEVLAGGAAGDGQAANLLLGATAEWTTRGLAARLTVGNKPGQAQRGSLTVRTFARATVEPGGPLEFDLAPGKTESFLLLFPAFRRPDVAVSDARLRGAVADGPLELLVRCGAGERHVRAYFEPLTVWAQRSREVVSQYRLPLHLRVRNARRAPLMAEVKALLPGWATARPVREMLALPARSTTSSPPLQMPLPAAAIAGPVQVVVELRGQGCEPVHALAEADLLRAGQCANLERAAVDGELGEWDGRLFARLASPRESSRRMEFTTGWDADHVYVAVRAGGAEPVGQKLGLLVDARAARRLGTPGGGVYVHVMLEADGAVRAVRPGSDEKLPVRGAWKGDEQGWRLELALSRTLLGAPAWSEKETDVGFNLAWLADSTDGASLIWSDGGEEGSSRACGLLRRSTSLTVRPSLKELPLLVRWR